MSLNLGRAAEGTESQEWRARGPHPEKDLRRKTQSKTDEMWGGAEGVWGSSAPKEVWWENGRNLWSEADRLREQG